ncbi:MAG: restriction endonuclease, partial [Myxococcales bacterium]|nr:restriction endonuclease [Myxococcales bacterium]
REYALFHWELAFPTVFDRGGFDVVLGNPPWERVKLQEQEFFASRDDSIASALNASERKKLIAELPVRDPELWDEWSRESRVAQGTSHFVRSSGRYPLCGRGDVNTYALFAEHNWRVLGPSGRAGFIVPSGIATDDTTKDYFQAIMRDRALRAMWEFENEGFFTAGKGHMLRFALTTLAGADEPVEAADFMFQGQSVADLDDPQRHFALTAEDIETINPNTGTCPIFRTQRDARLALTLYRRAGVLWRQDDPDGNPWGLRFMAMLHMANDSGLFRTRGELAQAGWTLQGNRFVKDGQVMLPMYEAKMTHIYTHRSGSFEAAAHGERPHRLPTPTD